MLMTVRDKTDEIIRKVLENYLGHTPTEEDYLHLKLKSMYVEDGCTYHATLYGQYIGTFNYYSFLSDDKATLIFDFKPA